jgi:putative glycosyltransferase (TIGR04372 family)
MDIYLGAKCKFMICSETGLNLVPTMFRRPIVFVNWVLIPYIHVWSTGVVITKKFFSVSKNRLLTYREILSRETGVFGDLGMALESGIQLHENSPAEIQAAAVEMNDRIDGLWVDSKEDIALQNRFWEIFGVDRLRNPELRIGAEFLRSNTNLLD